MICLGIDHRPSGALRAEQQPRGLGWVLIDPSYSEASALMRAQEVLGFTYITLPLLRKKAFTGPGSSLGRRQDGILYLYESRR